MLEEEVILPSIIGHAIGVIDPVLQRGEMELWAVGLIIPNVLIRRECLELIFLRREDGASSCEAQERQQQAADERTPSLIR